MKKIGSILALLLLSSTGLSSCETDGKKYEIVEVKTTLGDLYIWLYDDTPKHRDNFLKLARDGFYDECKFHRVIKDFMIQGGDPNSQKDLKQFWGNGGPGYTIPSEIVSDHYHKKGAVAAARKPNGVNPSWESSGSQFYIVQGIKFTDDMLNFVESQVQEVLEDNSFKFSADARETYKSLGGSPHLDMQYTVFGEVISGLEVIDKIAQVDTDEMDRPLNDIVMDINVLELTKGKVKKRFDFQVPDSQK